MKNLVTGLMVLGGTAGAVIIGTTGAWWVAVPIGLALYVAHLSRKALDSDETPPP